MVALIAAALAFAATPAAVQARSASLLQATPAEASADAGTRTPLPNATCLGCHAAGLMGAPKVDATGFEHSRHAGLQCVTCHAAITSVPHPQRLAAVPPQTCARCHGAEYQSYLRTAHGQAAALGLKSAPTCATCHDPHLALPPEDPRSRVAAGNRLATCRGCHTGADPKLAGFEPHPQPDDPAQSLAISYAHYFMVALLAGVFGFFGLHTVLWLQRGFVARLRGELPPLRHFGGPHIQRFTVADRLTHLAVILSFMLLALTGLPLMHPEASWAAALTRFWGGVRAMHVIHLVNAGITFGYFLFHLCYLGYRVLVKKQRYRLFGTDSLVPNWTDIRDIGRNFRWFLYLGPQPKMGRWTYWEKFDYWAVFWGVAMIGVSGLLLAAPVLFTRFIPGLWLNVSFVVHSEEALLATGFIFVFHFFHNHLRPEKFPIDVSILTGRVPLERFKEERPLQYDRLVQEGKLEQSIVPPPSALMTTISVIFGLAVVVTGVTLIALVIFAG
jgi:cytochrome b subunit of formate dehydrogenase